MKNSICRYFILLLSLMFLHLPAYAARVFTVALTSPLPAQFDMGSTSTGIFRVTNTNTGANTGERIFLMRFRMSSGSTFSNTTVAPAGWTLTTFGTTSITFQANSWANAIAVGGFVDFPIVLVLRSTTADVTDNLRDARASYTTTTTGPPFTSLATATNTAPTPWTDKSLVMVLTPSATSVPRNCTFTLTMQVTNRSTSNITTVTSVPKPPTITTTGGASATTVSVPANFNLNAGATGTMVWTYTTGATAGTISFSASARDSAGTRTSRTITAALITVTSASCFTAALVNSPPCLFSGDTATFTMTVTNNTGATLNNVQPSALTKGGTGTIGVLTGPVPASVATLTNTSATNFTWTAPVTGNVDDTYFVSGTATATGGFVTSSVDSGISTDIDGYIVAVSPGAVNASSNNQEIGWNVVHHACPISVKSVSIPIPVGWICTDAYSAVQISAVNTVETGLAGGWAAACGGANVVFTAPVGSEMPQNFSGDFMLTFTTPSTTGATPFNIIVTDTTPLSKTVAAPVTLNPFGSGSPNLNDTRTGTWREQF